VLLHMYNIHNIHNIHNNNNNTHSFSELLTTYIYFLFYKT
jgi:hypothetical protein